MPCKAKSKVLFQSAVLLYEMEYNHIRSQCPHMDIARRLSNLRPYLQMSEQRGGGIIRDNAVGKSGKSDK